MPTVKITGVREADRRAAPRSTPRPRKPKPSSRTAALAEAWRLAQSAADTTERRYIASLMVLTHFPTSRDAGSAAGADLIDWHDKIRLANEARAEFMAHANDKLSTAARPSSVRGLPR